MSLVNEMLQDLEQRNAADSKPLAGLHAVPAVPAGIGAVKPGQSNRRWIVALSVLGLVSGAWLWSGKTGHVSATDVDAELQPVTSTSPVIPEPMIARRAVLATNRLDYFLRSPPPFATAVPETVRAKPQVSGPATKPDIDQPAKTDRHADPEPGGSASVVRKVISPVVRFRRDGLAAMRAGKATVAERQFHRLVDADPENPESHLFLHAAYKAQSRSAAARSALLGGLERTSDPAQLAQVLANDFLAAGSVNHALAVLRAHRPAGHADLDYEARLAAVNQRAGNHDIAVQLYRQLVERQPANGAWWVGLAISQEANGNVGDAARSFATATAGGTLDVTLARYAAQRLERLETGS